MGELDEIDWAILGHIRGNSRKPLKGLAKERGIHHNTVQQRLKKLEKAGIVLGYQASVDYVKTGFDLHVMILIKVKDGRPGDTKQLMNVMSMPELEALYAMTGNWDAVSLWRLRDREHLNDVIRRLTGCHFIHDTMSHVILFPYKEPREFNPFIAGGKAVTETARGTSK